MRVLFVNTYYYPNMFGGAEHSVKLLASNFSKKYPCAIFSVDASTKGLQKETIDGVEIFRSGSSFFDFKARFTKNESLHCKIKNRLSDLYNPAASRHFRKVLDEFKPDIIHTNGLRGIGPQVWRIAQERGIKVVHTLRDYYAADPLMREKPPSNVFILLWRYFWNKKSSFLDVVTAPSLFTVEKMLKYGFARNKPFRSIPNAIPFEENVFLANIAYSKKLQRKRTRFLFAGALVKFKGILNLIDAFEILQKKADVELVVCGAGELSEYVKRAAENNNSIYFRGKISSDALKTEYLEADVCVIPSLWEEPFGRVVVEAAYNGCALIASNRGGIPEIIQELKAGILCDCSNVEQLAGAMYDLCDRKKRFAQLDVFTNTVAFFSETNNTSSFNFLYKELFENSVILNPQKA